MISMIDHLELDSLIYMMEDIKKDITLTKRISEDKVSTRHLVKTIKNIDDFIEAIEEIKGRK